MNRVYIIGAGQIGSRHLQALKSASVALDITVIDPSKNSLSISKKRYDEMPSGKYKQLVSYKTSSPRKDNLDLAIIATNSDSRAKVVNKLISVAKPKYLIMEKILFQKKVDYKAIEDLLNKNKIKAWVNCPMRVMPFFQSIKKMVGDDKLIYFHISGSNYGLVTNAIHYIDYIAYLSECQDYTTNTKQLEKKIYASKRLGFSELNGTLSVNFESGSQGILSCYHDGDLPIIISIYNRSFRCIFRQAESLAWLANHKNNWQWEEIKAPIPYQSQMTNKLVQDLFSSRTINLPTYSESAKLHLQHLEALRRFINTLTAKTFNYYPFT